MLRKTYDPNLSAASIRQQGEDEETTTHPVRSQQLESYVTHDLKLFTHLPSLHLPYVLVHSTF
jgi:hypothetical protein